jgi:serine/threonine-protein kinase
MNKALGTLLGSSAALTALAVYQWFELLELRNGKAPACAINSTINCATVWNSPLAALVHDTLGMPMAALGIVYGAVGLLLAVLALRATRTGTDTSAFLAGSKLWAAIGVVSCMTFLGASVQAGAVCLTCLGTYVLTGVYAFGAFKLLPPPLVPPSNALTTGGAWALVLAVPVYLALLGPGAKTPKSSAAKVEAVAGADGKTTVADFSASLAALPERDKLQISYARAAWQQAPSQDNRAYPVRIRQGPANAPVRIVDFTDIICGHCRAFDGMSQEVLHAAPEGSISVEPRHFPLDGECNPDIGKVWGDGVRCLAAKIQICLESNPPVFFDVRHELFANQQALTKELVMQVATKRSGQSAEALLACVASDETGAKLRQDIEYARRYHIEGTPLVLLNDRETPPVPVFLLGMALTGGDANAAVFNQLPPPPRE